MLDTAGKFIKIVVPSVIKPIRVLWNEMIGFVFIVFAVIFGASAYRAWRTIQTGGEGEVGMLGGGFLALLMLVFGVSSFRRARKIDKQ